MKGRKLSVGYKTKPELSHPNRYQDNPYNGKDSGYFKPCPGGDGPVSVRGSAVLYGNAGHHQGEKDKESTDGGLNQHGISSSIHGLWFGLSLSMGTIHGHAGGR